MWTVYVHKSAYKQVELAERKAFLITIILNRNLTKSVREKAFEEYALRWNSGVEVLWKEELALLDKTNSF